MYSSCSNPETFQVQKGGMQISPCVSWVQAALIICGLFICNFMYMRLKNGLFSGTYPLIYSNSWSFYMQIHYMRAYFWSPYLSNITRSTCTAIANLYLKKGTYVLKRIIVIQSKHRFLGTRFSKHLRCFAFSLHSPLRKLCW
jgi:hypothetical protein